MKMQTLLLAATVIAVATSAASAQPYQTYPQDRLDTRDGNNNAQNGGYGRRDASGGYRQDDRRNAVPGYYRQGAYEQNCRRGGNEAAGTIFGALAGGLIGSAASNGNGGAVVGGAVLGGLLGNTIARDIDCEAQPYAFQTYSTGLNGRIGRRYEWNHGGSRGYFIPTREYRRSGTVCRDFTETSWRNGRSVTRSGTSCRAQDGHWRFD
jgi:surface antigen